MEKEPFQVAVNAGQFKFAVDPQLAQNLDVAPDGAGRFHVLKDGKAFKVELIEADFLSKTYKFRINGAEYSSHISDRYERLIEALGLTVGGAQKQNAVKAPMPGLVLSVLIEPGQTVKKGDPLLILEAMKMENVLKAAGDGTVKSVKAIKGQAVEKGALLLEMV